MLHGHHVRLVPVCYVGTLLVLVLAPAGPLDACDCRVVG